MKMIRRIAVKIVLIAGSLSLASLAVMSFLAEREFDGAGRLAAQYRWAEADAGFGRSIKLDPFNAEHFAGFGAFLLTQSEYRDFKEPYLEKAAALYRRASRLNPGNAEYLTKLGVINCAMALESKDAVIRAMAYIEDSAKFDPMGFNSAYAAGYAAIPLWEKLDRDEKELVLGRLKCALTVKPWFGPKYIYPRLWKYTKDFKPLREITPDNETADKALYGFLIKNGLWQFCAGQRKKLGSYAGEEKKAPVISAPALEVVTPEDWRGVSASGEGVYKKGCMYWTGTMSALMNIPKGRSTIRIKARGVPSDGVYPYMIVELDAEEIGDAYVDSVEWKDYDFRVKAAGGAKVLSITFANDGGNPEKKEDRNLFVGEARAE